MFIDHHISTTGRLTEGKLLGKLLNDKGSIVKTNTIYSGTFIDEKLNGQGRIECINGTIIEGEFKNNLLNGNGVYILPVGMRNEGKFLDGKMLTKSIKYHLNYVDIQISEKGDIIIKGKEGFCIIIFHKGAVFEGYMNMNSGSGKLAFHRDANLKIKVKILGGTKINQIRGVKGMVYEGSFRNYLLNGKGRILLPNGNVIEGNFYDNLLNGKGSYGSSLMLTFLNGYNNRNSMHIYIYIYVCIYIYLELYISEDGKVSKMKVNNNTVTGKGILLLQNGEKLIGKLKYGKLIGKGKINNYPHRGKNSC